MAAPVRGVEGLEASVGIVTLDQVDPDTIGEQVAAAAAEVDETAQLSGITPGPGRVATSRLSVMSWPSPQRMTQVDRGAAVAVRELDGRALRVGEVAVAPLADRDAAPGRGRSPSA